MKQYLDLIKTVLDKGITKTDRTGTGTRSIFGYQTRFDLREGFPLVTVKKTNFAAITHELLWFISGDTNIRYLVQNGVNIWNEWPLKRLNEKQHGEGRPKFTAEEFISQLKEDTDFADFEGDLGPVYGKQWRDFGGVDQLAEAIKTIQTNPDSRRIIVSAWNPSEIPDMALPPCHAFFQFVCEPLSKRERMAIANKKVRQFNLIGIHELSEEDQHAQFDGFGIPRHYVSLMLTQRSADILLGVPFNIASYALLLEMVAKVTGTVVKELIYSLGDAHIYSNHLEAAEALLEAPQYPLPRLELGSTVAAGTSNANPKRFLDLDAFTFDDIKLFNYQSGPYVKLPVAV